MLVDELKRFEHSVIGEGSPCVVFLNGFRMNYDTWDKVALDIATEHRVLLYNRLGVGASSKAETDQVGAVVMRDMNALFSKLNIQRPFLLVAHSFGGIFANLYARHYPDNVLGIVFVDATHPEEVAAMDALKAPTIFNTLNNGIKSIEKIFYSYKYSEAECIQQTVLDIQNAGVFPSIPIAVVSGVKNLPFALKKGYAVHMHYQQKLLNLSNASKHYLCSKSSHFPQLTEPKIVASAIRETLRKDE